MTSPEEHLIELILPSDEPFLWQMLYQAIYVPAGTPAPPSQIVYTPELSRYVERWGKENDDGLKAIASDTLQPIGAAWMRLLRGEGRGYGYIDDPTPELSIAVMAEYRGKGIGTRLLQQLLERAQSRYAAVSLSVSGENPAISLYERLGFAAVGWDGSSMIMRKGLTARGDEQTAYSRHAPEPPPRTAHHTRNAVRRPGDVRR